MIPLERLTRPSRVRADAVRTAVTSRIYPTCLSYGSGDDWRKQPMTRHDTITREGPQSAVTATSHYIDMIWIVGGSFRMGSDHHYAEEAPAHRVTVDPFWIDCAPVTNREFRNF